ncbi:TPA: hypothetical protein ACUNAI_004596 [Escherichia coli]
MSSKANYESLASVMPRNEQEADAVVDPVIAEMNARLEAEFAAENGFVGGTAEFGKNRTLS